MDTTAIGGPSRGAPFWLKLAYGGFVTVLVPVY
jgi:hypothetical protein